LEDGKQVNIEIPTIHGKIETMFDLKREGNTIRIRREGPAKAWNVLLVGISSVESAETVNGSALIKANEEMNELKIQLR
jgi:hypothetical protein